MHNARFLRAVRTFCSVWCHYALCIMNYALNYSSILPLKNVRHLFTNLPHFFVEI